MHLANRNSAVTLYTVFRLQRRQAMPSLVFTYRLIDALSPVHTSNNVEATFDIVAFDSVASTLLLVWTGLYVIHSTRHATSG